MWPGHQFWWSKVLESEVESMSSWMWTPPWCGCPSSSSLSPWPSPSPCWSSPLFLINNTCMEPSVSSEKQLTRLERTWRSNCCGRALVIGPCIVCKGEMSSSHEILQTTGPCLTMTYHWFWWTSILGRQASCEKEEGLARPKTGKYVPKWVVFMVCVAESITKSKKPRSISNWMITISMMMPTTSPIHLVQTRPWPTAPIAASYLNVLSMPWTRWR
jgi:hypothetical protein